MPPFLRFNFQFQSFWVGVIISTVFWWVFFFVRSHWAQWRQTIQKQMKAARESLSASTETRLRHDVLRNTQTMHLASALFPLDDIVIEPRILPPPELPILEESIEDEQAITQSDIFAQTLPYLPDWPELSAAFNAPTMSLVNALKGGANLILMGAPGSGKTVALAHLANRVSRQEENLGDLADMVPFLFHAADVAIESFETKTDLDVLVDAIASQVSTLTLSRLPNLLESSLKNGDALMLMDGLDELPPSETRQIVRWAGQLIQEYPKTRWVIAASPTNYAGLNQLGLIPVSMAVWGRVQKAEFIKKWETNWLEYLLTAEQAKAAKRDMLLLNSWLLSATTYLSPIEFVLQVWGTYAGDTLGPQPTSTFESYLRRMTTNIPNARPAMEALARQMVTYLTPSCLQKEAENWLAEFEQVISAKPEGQEGAENIAIGRIIPSLLQSEVLTKHSGGRLSFSHPMLLGYLAGSAFAKRGLSEISNQPEWTGKQTTFTYTAAFGDVSEQVNELFASKADPLQRNYITPIKWLRLAPRNVAWRQTALRFIVTYLQRQSFSINFGARALTALSLTSEAGLTTIFRQWLQSENLMLRYLAILGSGLMQDSQSVDALSAQLTDGSIPLLGQASCLSLSIMSDKNAKDAVISGLLHGSESIRDTAAEILAHDPVEGYDLLKEALEMDDLLVRRAAVHGLSLLEQPWATELLEKTAVEDGQWVVRNAASQALETKKQKEISIQPIPPLHETPWLISFAASLGIGVSPGKPARELLLRALREGTPDQQIQALEYLRLNGTEDDIVQLYNLYYSSDGEIHEAAYSAIWHIAASGIQLPPPNQFGLG